MHGDILFLTEQRAMVIPSGWLLVRKHHAVKVSGASNTFLAKEGEAPAWQPLLAEQRPTPRSDSE